MDFEECIKKRMAKEVIRDDELIKSLLKTSKNKLDSEEKLELDEVTFASKISFKALAWIQIIFPIFFVLIALNEWFNIGTNNLLSKALWEKNIDKFNMIFVLAVQFAFFFRFDNLYVFLSCC